MMPGNALRIQNGIAEVEFARPTMRDDVYGRNALPPLEIVRNLADAVAGCLQHHDFRPVRSFGEDVCRVANRCIDEYDDIAMLPLLFGRHFGNCREQGLMIGGIALVYRHVGGCLGCRFNGLGDLSANNGTRPVENNARLKRA